MDIPTGEQIFQNPHPLETLRSAVHLAGFVGDDDAVDAANLLAYSRFLADPICGVIRGEPSSGKSELIKAVRYFTPSDEQIYFTTVTQVAPYYQGSREEEPFRNKLIIINEQSGLGKSTYTWRSWISEGEITRITYNNLIHVNHPICMVFTTADDKIERQLASRLIEIQVDDTKEQNERVISNILADSSQMRDQQTLQQFRDAIFEANRLRTTTDIIIPYAAGIEFPTYNAQYRRGAKNLMRLIKVHAYLSQHNRENIIINGENVIIASQEDHEIVRPFFDKMMLRSEDIMPKRARKLLNDIPDALERRNCEKEESGEEVLFPNVLTRSAMAKYLSVSQDVVKYSLPYWLESGAFEELEPGKRNQKRYAWHGEGGLDYLNSEKDILILTLKYAMQYHFDEDNECKISDIPLTQFIRSSSHENRNVSPQKVTSCLELAGAVTESVRKYGSSSGNLNSMVRGYGGIRRIPDKSVMTTMTINMERLKEIIKRSDKNE